MALILVSGKTFKFLIKARGIYFPYGEKHTAHINGSRRGRREVLSVLA